MKYYCFYYVFNQINAALMSTRDILIHVDGSFFDQTSTSEVKGHVDMYSLHCIVHMVIRREIVVAMTTFIQDVINSHTHVEQSAVFWVPKYAKHMSYCSI